MEGIHYCHQNCTHPYTKLPLPSWSTALYTQQYKVNFSSFNLQYGSILPNSTYTKSFRCHLGVQLYIPCSIKLILALLTYRMAVFCPIQHTLKAFQVFVCIRRDCYRSYHLVIQHGGCFLFSLCHANALYTVDFHTSNLSM